MIRIRSCHVKYVHYVMMIMYIIQSEPTSCRMY